MMPRDGRHTMGWRMRSGILAAVGGALAVGSLPASAAVGPSLGAARSFGALGGSTVTNTGVTTYIVGDVGVSPGSAIVGLTQAQVSGGIYVGGDAEADQAHSDAALAYAFLAGMASNTNLSSTDLGGLTLAPGVYTFNSSAALTGAMFLDAGGDSKAVFVFQIGTSFDAANGSSITVINGGADYDESNIYWQVGSSATIGTTSAFLGIIIADQSVTLKTGATLTGGALALNGATTLDSNAITSPPLAISTTAAPINLTAGLSGNPATPGADLSWTDASDDETEFRVYRKDGAGPGFTLVGTVPTTDMSGVNGGMTYRDLLVDPPSTVTYRVTAFGVAGGESVPSNEALVDTSSNPPPPPSGRSVDLDLGGRRSLISDRNRVNQDRISIQGTYSVSDLETGVPIVLDPRTEGVTIQVRAPGSLVVLDIPPGDPNWKVSKKGVYRWHSRDGRHQPSTSLRIDTRNSVFEFGARGSDFGSVPVNDITVTLIFSGATGSDTRTWDLPGNRQRGGNVFLMLSK